MKTSLVTTIELHCILQTVHITSLHKAHRYIAQRLDSSASRISTLYISVEVIGVSVNTLRHKTNFKNFWKTPLPRSGRIVCSSCDTECSSVATLVQSDAVVVYFEVLILILLLSRVSPQYCLEGFCEQFPLTAEVSFMLTFTSQITIIAREVWRYVTV